MKSFGLMNNENVRNLLCRTDSRYAEECNKNAEKADSVIVSNNSAHRQTSLHTNSRGDIVTVAQLFLLIENLQVYSIHFVPTVGSGKVW
jgi:hypothetical protein